MAVEENDRSPGEPLAVAEFELTPEEWVEAGVAYLFDHDLHTANRARQRRAFTWMGAAMTVLLLLVGAVVEAGVTAAVVAALVGGTAPLYRRLLRRSLTHAARHGVADGLFGPHRLEVRPGFLRDITSGYETRWRWTSVRGVGENDGTFLIQTGPTALLPLPASAFRDSQSLRRFGDAFFAQLSRARGAGPSARLPGA